MIPYLQLTKSLGVEPPSNLCNDISLLKIFRGALADRFMAGVLDNYNLGGQLHLIGVETIRQCYLLSKGGLIDINEMSSVKWYTLMANAIAEDFNPIELDSGFEYKTINSRNKNILREINCPPGTAVTVAHINAVAHFKNKLKTDVRTRLIKPISVF